MDAANKFVLTLLGRSLQFCEEKLLTTNRCTRHFLNDFFIVFFSLTDAKSAGKVPIATNAKRTPDACTAHVRYPGPVVVSKAGAVSSAIRT